MTTEATYTVKPNIITRRDWAIMLLNSLGIHPNDSNVRAILAWETQEGGHTDNSRTWNPLNTTMKAPGATYGGAQGNIAAYPDFLTGLNATADTLREDRYSGLVNALRAGSYEQIRAAIISSPWGTHTLPAEGRDVALGDPRVGSAVLDKLLTGPVGDAAEGVAHLAEKVPGVKLLENLSSGETWKRIGFVVGGFVLGILGILIIVRPSRIPGISSTPAGIIAGAAGA